MTSILPKDFQTLLDKLPNTLILTSHINPDGDGLGAMFAMGEALKTRGTEHLLRLRRTGTRLLRSNE